MTSQTLQDLAQLSAAEDFFAYFDLDYDPSVLRVNRLHILKRFHQYLKAEREGIESKPSDMQGQAYRSLLERAYHDFIVSTPAREKVFKVFQDAEGSRFGLDSLRKTLPSQRTAVQVS